MSEIPPVPPPAPTPAAAPGLPWEEPNAGLGSILPTAGQLIRSPFQAFSKMSLTVDLIRPIAYFVAFTLVAALFNQIWSFVFHDTLVRLVRGMAGPQFESFAPLFEKPGLMQVVLGFVVAPLIMIVLLFVWTALVHVVLLMVGGAKGGFAATLRAICYAETAQVATVIPILGGLIAFFWRLILQMIGLSEAHRTDAWRAVIAVLAPLFVCCLCAIGLGIAFGAALMQVLQQAR